MDVLVPEVVIKLLMERCHLSYLQVHPLSEGVYNIHAWCSVVHHFDWGEPERAPH